MRACSTADVPLDAFEELRDLDADFELEIDDQQIALKGGIPPSWVAFFGEASWFVQTLGVYAAIYVGEIVKEAGKETWKNRRVIVSAAGNRIKQFSDAVVHLRRRLRADTRIEIGLPAPDDYDGTRLELVGTDAENLALQIALFVHHLPGLLKLIDEEHLTKGKVAAGIHLQILDDASLEVWWQDSASLKRQVRVLLLSHAQSGRKNERPKGIR